MFNNLANSPVLLGNNGRSFRWISLIMRNIHPVGRKRSLFHWLIIMNNMLFFGNLYAYTIIAERFFFKCVNRDISQKHNNNLIIKKWFCRLSYNILYSYYLVRYILNFKFWAWLVFYCTFYICLIYFNF